MSEVQKEVRTLRLKLEVRTLTKKMLQLILRRRNFKNTKTLKLKSRKAKM